MYEKIKEPPINRKLFIKRMAQHIFYVLLILLLSLVIGTTGFYVFEGHGLEDAILHATFILSGFGLVSMPTTTAGRMFAGFYGLYANIFFLAGFTILFAPVIHRILHKLHIDDE